MEQGQYILDGYPHFKPGPPLWWGRVSMAPPSLRDNTAPAQRLAALAARAGARGPVWLDLETVRGLAPFMGGGEFFLAVDQRPETRGRLFMAAPASRNVRPHGLVVDVGSTTLVTALIDLETLAVIRTLTTQNPQTAHAADILSRAHLAEKQGFASRLGVELVRGVNQAAAEITRLAGIRLEDILAASIAGNTAMTHFLAGLPLTTLIREPYTPLANRFEGLTAGRLGLELAPLTPVLLMPNKGSYFGGDLLAGLAASGLTRREEPCLMVDVGTNAEVVLGQKDWLIGAAGAAGPALEGGVARLGMAAAGGAIDSVRIDRETRQVRYTTIGGGPPRGMCGSGIIDLYAELFLSGIIDMTGRLTLEKGHPRRAETDEGPAFVLATAEEAAGHEPITLSEVELDILGRSKAGMYTILETVLGSVGLEFRDIESFFVAGTFGQYIRPASAVAVGMLPDIPLDRFVPLGNASLKGAALALVSAEARGEIEAAFERLTYLELNVNQDFMNRFSAARFLPHTHRELFPSVGTVLR